MKSDHKKPSQNYIYGRLPALNCLEVSKVKGVYLQNNFSDQKILSAISKKGISPKYVDLETLNKLTHNGNHQGILVETYPHEYSSVDEILKACDGKEQPLILILDEIEDPHNFGAIIRTCEAAGVDGIIIPSDRSVSVNATVIKTSVGID